MAKPSHSDGARADKPSSSSINTLKPKSNGSPVRGLVPNSLVTPDFQVAILKAIDAVGTAEIGSLIELVPDHPQPVAALIAMADHGLIRIDTKNVIDTTSMVSRRNDPEAPEAASIPGPPPPALPGSETLEAATARGKRTSFRSVFTPEVTMINGDHRRHRGDGSPLHRPGIYVALWRQPGTHLAYVGCSADVGNRISAGPHLNEPRAADVIFTLTDENDAITLEMAKCLERMAAEAIEVCRGIQLINEMPQGGRMSADEYVELRFLVARLLLAIKTSGESLSASTDRDLMAGPKIAPGDKAPLRFDGLPEGDLYELEACGVTARAIRTKYDCWIVLRGSQVRPLPVPSATSSIFHRRALFLHSGILTPAGDVLILERDVLLSSGSMAAQFVTGAKSPGLAGWRTCAPAVANPQPV